MKLKRVAIELISGLLIAAIFIGILSLMPSRLMAYDPGGFYGIKTVGYSGSGSPLMVRASSVSGPILVGKYYGESIISNATYYGTIAITNNSTANTTGCSVNLTSLSTTLINDFGVGTDFDEVAIRNSYGEDVKFMPGNGANPWIFWVPSIGQNEIIYNTLYVGNTSLSSTKYYFPGTTGMAVTDDASLEPGDNFTISFTGYLDTSATGIIVNKPTASVNITTGSGNVSVVVQASRFLSTVVTSGYHNVTLSVNSTDCELYIDGVRSDNTTGAATNDYAGNWQIGSSTTPYMESCNITVGGVLKGSWVWEYGATFTDASGYSNTGTPTFRTTSSDADVSAVLLSFLPISPAQSTVSSNTSWPQLLTAVPDEPGALFSNNTSPGFFFAGIFNGVLDTANIPRSFFWQNFCFLIIIAAGILTFRIQPSLLIKSIIMLALIVLFAMEGTNVFGMFVAIYFGLFAAGVILFSRSYGF